MMACWWGEGPCPEPKQGPAGPPIAGAMDAGGRHHGLSCSYSEWEVKQVWVTFASKALPTTLSARYYSLIWQ